MTIKEIRLKKKPIIYHVIQLRNRGKYIYTAKFHNDLTCKINIL